MKVGLVIAVTYDLHAAGDLLRQHVQHKSPDHVAADHQQQQKIAIADGGSGLHADKQGLFNTHMTSKLQRLQLTQDIEVSYCER